MRKTPTKIASIPSLDDCANDLDAHRLSELPRDVLARLTERASIAKVRCDLAMMMGARDGDSPQAAMLSVAEAAKLVGRSPGWIRRMARQRDWPFAHRVSRKLMLLDRDGLQHWLATRRA